MSISEARGRFNELARECVQHDAPVVVFKGCRPYVVIEPYRGQALSPCGGRAESPDSWERLEGDAEALRNDIAWNLGDFSPSDFEDDGDSVQNRVVALVRRAKALAEAGL